MNYLALLIVLLFFLSMCHAFLFSKRLSPILARPFEIPNYITNSRTADSSMQRIIENYQMLPTFIFFVCPILLYRSFKFAPIDNIIITYIALIIIVVISIVGLWFNITKVGAKNLGQKILLLKPKTVIQQKNFLPEESTRPLIKLKSKKKTSLSQKVEAKMGEKEFAKFLQIVEKFECYNGANFYFSLGGHKIKEKGRTITTAQACFILTFFWYHEVLKSNSYTKEVIGGIWSQWESQLNIQAPLTRGNWDTFKNNYLHNEKDNTKYEDLKESTFYTLFREFYTKHHTLVN